jgi:ribose 5-phosphate isomerase B
MIYIASDHRGYQLKEKIKTWLTEWGYEFEDMGAHSYDEQDDYPDYIHVAALKVAENPDENRGIILGGSGQGEAIAANRHKGVRALVYYGGSEELITASRVHNDANVLSLGAAPGMTMAEMTAMDDVVAQTAVKTFLETKFPRDERHMRRINKIDNG